MALRWVGRITVVCVGLSFGWSVHRTHADTGLLNGELWDRVMARATAIYSIRLEYEYRQGMDDLAMIRQQVVPRQVLVVQGDDWLSKEIESPNFRMKRDSALLTFTELSGLGKTFRTLRITAPQSIPELLAQDTSCHVLRAGTLPFARQADFLVGHRQAVRILPRETLRADACDVWEWDVDRLDFDDAFLWIPPALAQAPMGRLRLYIDPRWGGALTRMEYRTAENQCVLGSDAHEFFEAAPGLWLPKVEQMQMETARGTYWEEFRVQQATHVNDVIDPKEFELKVPLRTRVHDARPGVPATVFHLTHHDQMDELNRAIAGASTGRRTFPWRRLLFMGQVMIVVCLVIWRAMRSPATTT